MLPLLPCSPSKRTWGRSMSMRFQQPRYACFTSLAFSSMVLVKKASLQGWRGTRSELEQDRRGIYCRAMNCQGISRQC
jgi:hypothetical protein